MIGSAVSGKLNEVIADFNQALKLVYENTGASSFTPQESLKEGVRYANSLNFQEPKLPIKSIDSNLIESTAEHGTEDGSGGRIDHVWHFGPLWSKSSLLEHLKDTTIKPITRVRADVREILVSMASRLMRFIESLKTFLPDSKFKPFVKSLQSMRTTFTKNGQDFVFKVGNLESYQFVFEFKEKDQTYIMSIPPLNFKLEKKIVHATKLPNSDSNQGGWRVGSDIHTITLDHVNNEGEVYTKPLVLEIGVKPICYNDHAIYTKLLHTSDSDEVEVIEDKHDKYRFGENLGLWYPKSFVK